MIIYMKTTAPNTSYRRYEGLTQVQINDLLDELGYTAYETVTEEEYNTNTSI